MAVIAIDARPLANPIDGISRYTYEILYHLVQNEGHEWLLYSHKPLTAFPKDVRVRSPSAHLNSVFVSQTLFPRWMLLDKVDAFWSPRHHLPVLSTTCNLVVTIHDIAWKSYPETMPRSRWLLESLLTPRAIKCANTILAVSQSTKLDVERIWPTYGDKIVVASPGAKSFAFSERAPMASKFILAVGTIEPRKNYRLLLQGFAEISEKVPHNLVIVGRPGWGGVDLAGIIEEFDLQNRVVWQTNLADEALGNWYRYADLVVSTSLYEGFNLPLLEAISAGTPILATDLGVHREVAGEAGVYFEPHITEFSQSLMRLLSDDSNRRQLSKNCKAQTKLFNWKAAADVTLTSLLTEGG